MERKREDGFYWVKDTGTWYIAEYINDGDLLGYWEHTGVINKFNDKDFEEIDERRVERDDDNYGIAF